MQSLTCLIAAATTLHLVLLPQVSATSVSAARVNIAPLDLLLNKPSVKLTVAFTPTTALLSGATITMHYSSGFYANGVTPTMDSCSVSQLSPTFAAINNRIVITTSGASITSGSSFTITIGGLTMGSARTSSQFQVLTSADSDSTTAGAPGQSPDSYTSGTRTVQFSMTIAESERSFANSATVTISFSPSSAISTESAITLVFPEGMFKNAACSDSYCSFSFKSSLSNAFLRRTDGTTSSFVITNGAQSTSPTGTTIPANVPFTITISGLILGPPRGSIPKSVYISTSSDTVPFSSDIVDSGPIGLGSYVNGSCPYGMTWSNAARACTSCSSDLTISSGGYIASSATHSICDNFSDCLSCSTCPYSQAISSSKYSMLGPPATPTFYACSNSSSRCPAGSGKLLGDNGGCLPCPYDMYNDGSSDRCQYCPSGTYPNYSMMKASVLIDCSFCTFSRSGSAIGSVQMGYVMKKSATSCSSMCPAGTGVLSDYQAYRNEIIYVEEFSRSLSYASGTLLKFLWGAYSPSSPSSNSQNVATPQKDKGCFPCVQWYISKGNSYQPCSEGASDRASLNTMGDTYASASRCIPNICPWPYVPPGALTMNADLYYDRNVALDAHPSFSSTELCLWGHVHLGGTVATISVIAVILLGTYAVAISFAAIGQDDALTHTRRRKLVLGMLLATVSPAVDFVSDLLYIVSTLFYNDIICIVCCFFYLLPMFFFWRMLVKHGVYFGCYIGKPPAFAVMQKYDSIPKALLGFVGYLPLYIINLPFSLPLFLVGHVLYCCKVFPISRVSNLWLRECLIFSPILSPLLSPSIPLDGHVT
jgi:hypothetical protein